MTMHRPSSHARRVLLPAALLLGVPLLAACGGDDTAAVDPSGAVGTEAAQPSTGPGGAGFPGASGLVADVSGSTAQVQGVAGQVAVTWTGATTFTREVSGSLDDVVVGSCVVATVEDDVTVSLRVTEASEDGCTAGLGGFGGPGRGGPGPGDGERPEGMPSDMPSDMPSEMPSGMPEGDRPEGLPGGFGSAVIGEVTAVGADTVTVAALDIAAGTEGGADSTTEQTLAVDATTEVVTTVSATAADVAEGACLTARGDADDLGAVTAESVALSDPVDGSCTSGFGGPGGFGGGRGPGSTADDAGQDS